MTVNGLNLYNYCFNNPITYIDPDGTFSIVGLIIGTIIGAAVGFGITAYEDYKDDGKVFNGSIGWQTYLGATLVGGAGGGLLGGYILPALRHIPTGLKVLTDTAGFSHVVVTSTGTIVGGKAIAGAGTLAALGGLTYMFSSTERPKNNKKQNEQVKSALRELGYDPKTPEAKDLSNLIEREIRKRHLSLGYSALVKVIKELLGLL